MNNGGRSPGRIRGLRSHLEPGRFFRSVALLSGGTAAGQVLVFALSPIITRLVSVDDVGQMGLFTVAFAVSTMLATGAYEFAVVAAREDREAATLVVLAVLVSVPMTALSVLATAFFILNGLFGYDQLPIAALPILAVAVVANSIFVVCRYWLVRFDEFPHLSKLTPIQQVGRSGSQVALSWASLGFAGLAIGDAIGRVIGAASAARYGAVRVAKALGPDWKGRLIGTARQYKRFPFLTAPSALIDAVGSLAPVPLVTRNFGLAAAGYLALVFAVLAAPSALIGASVADVFLGRIAKLKTERPQACESLLVRTSAGLFATACVPAAVLLVLGPWLFATVFGSEWRTAGQVAAAMSVLFVAGFSVSPVSGAIIVFGAQADKLIYDFLVVAVTVLSFAWGAEVKASFITVMWVLSVTNALAYVVYFLLILHSVRREVARFT